MFWFILRALLQRYHGDTASDSSSSKLNLRDDAEFFFGRLLAKTFPEQSGHSPRLGEGLCQERASGQASVCWDNGFNWEAVTFSPEKTGEVRASSSKQE